MRRTRVIPVLLLKQRGFYKTRLFQNPKYLGDPINILRIFNEKEVDEVCVLDIAAVNDGPQMDYLGEFASECFMPLAYGGGITNIAQISKLFRIGFEKCIINTAFIDSPELVKEASREFGSQSIVVSLDAKKKLFGGYELFVQGGKRGTNQSVRESARQAEDLGAGEILLNSIDRDGMMEGYDLDLAEEICNEVSVPVVVCGGAGSLEDMKQAAGVGANGVAAGSFFVFQGPHRAVLINAPKQKLLSSLLP